MPKQLNIIERATLARRLEVNKRRIDQLESLLAGVPIRTVRFADLSVIEAKIESLSADKITAGSLEIGEKILVSDGTNNRILITRNVIKISKPGVDVETGNIKDMVILNQEDAHKLFYSGFITSGSYTHNLNARPIFFCFSTDSTTNPTYFSLTKSARSSTTQIVNIPNPSYLVIFRERI